MSYRDQRLNSHLSPRGSGAFLQGYSSEKSPLHSSHRSVENETVSNELNYALSRIELLTAEKDQLKNTLKVVLERRPSEASTDPSLNIHRRVNQQEYSSPKVHTIAELERKIEFLQKENDDLKYNLHRKNERLSTTIKENNGYLEKMVEFERIRNYNSQLNIEMQKLNKEIREVESKVKELEEKETMLKENAVNEENFMLQAASHINHILGLLEKCDPNHYIVDSFMKQFENLETLQKCIEEKQFGSLALMSLKYIGDLIANSNISHPSASRLGTSFMKNDSSFEGSNIQKTKSSLNSESHSKNKFQNFSPSPFDDHIAEQQSKRNVTTNNGIDIRRSNQTVPALPGGQTGSGATNHKDQIKSPINTFQNFTDDPFGTKRENLQPSMSRILEKPKQELSLNPTAKDFNQSNQPLSARNGLKNPHVLHHGQRTHNESNKSEVLPDKLENNLNDRIQQDDRSRSLNDDKNFLVNTQNPTTHNAFVQNTGHAQSFDGTQQPHLSNYPPNSQIQFSNKEFNRNVSNPQFSPSHHNPYNFAIPPYQGYFVPAPYVHQFPLHYQKDYQYPPNNFTSYPQHHSESLNQGDRPSYYYSNDAASRLHDNGRHNPLSSRRSEPNINTKFNTASLGTVGANYHEPDAKRIVTESLIRSHRGEIAKPEDERLVKQPDSQMNAIIAEKTDTIKETEQNQHFSTSESKEVAGETPEELEIDLAASKIDKQTQIGGNNSLKNLGANSAGEFILNKATQTSSYSSKQGTKRENVPPLDLGSMKKNIENAENKQLQRSAEQKLLHANIKADSDNDSILLQSNPSPKKFLNETHAEDNLSRDDPKLMSQYQRENSNNIPSSGRVGRATLGVMGNPELSRGSNKTSNNSNDNSSPTMKASGQKSFKVSFGKTLSLSQFANKEKPRFEIVPNEMICIEEATHKKRMSPARQFNIITNEPKAYYSEANTPGVENSAGFSGKNGQSPSLPITQLNKIQISSARTDPF